MFQLLGLINQLFLLRSINAHHCTHDFDSSKSFIHIIEGQFNIALQIEQAHSNKLDSQKENSAIVIHSFNWWNTFKRLN